MRFGLIPIGDRGQIILQRQVTAFALPAQTLHGYLQIPVKADRVCNMPAILAKTVLIFNAIETSIESTEIVINILAVRAGSHFVTVGTAKIIFLTGAADSRKFIITVEIKFYLTFSPPAGTVGAVSVKGADIMAGAFDAIYNGINLLVGQRINPTELGVEVSGMVRHRCLRVIDLVVKL